MDDLNLTEFPEVKDEVDDYGRRTALWYFVMGWVSMGIVAMILHVLICPESHIRRYLGW